MYVGNVFKNFNTRKCVTTMPQSHSTNIHNVGLNGDFHLSDKLLECFSYYVSSGYAKHTVYLFLDFLKNLCKFLNCT